MSHLNEQNDEQPDGEIPRAAAKESADLLPGGNGNGAAADDYGADKIRILEGLEAVRTRPAMYISPNCR